MRGSGIDHALPVPGLLGENNPWCGGVARARTDSWQSSWPLCQSCILLPAVSGTQIGENARLKIENARSETRVCKHSVAFTTLSYWTVLWVGGVLRTRVPKIHSYTMECSKMRKPLAFWDALGGDPQSTLAAFLFSARGWEADGDGWL